MKPKSAVTAALTSAPSLRSEEHTSELQSQSNLVCRLLLEKKKNYRIVEKLCGGGMSVVYKADDTASACLVALKFRPDELSQGPQAFERFGLEELAASAVNH